MAKRPGRRTLRDKIMEAGKPAPSSQVNVTQGEVQQGPLPDFAQNLAREQIRRAQEAATLLKKKLQNELVLAQGHWKEFLQGEPGTYFIGNQKNAFYFVVYEKWQEPRGYKPGRMIKVVEEFLPTEGRNQTIWFEHSKILQDPTKVRFVKGVVGETQYRMWNFLLCHLGEEIAAYHAANSSNVFSINQNDGKGGVEEPQQMATA